MATITSFAHVEAAPLIEESFNYPADSSLGTNAPWSGDVSANLQVIAGGLSVPMLGNIIPAGNAIQISGGVNSSAFRSFSATPIVAGSIYCAVLVRCSTLPTSSQFVACLLPAGATTANSASDPLDLYVRPLATGYGFAIRSMNSGTVSAGNVLAPDSTHLIVLKYTLGAGAQASLYVDPVPGNAEPAVADATISAGGFDDDGGLDDDGGPAPASSLQGILFQSSGLTAQGVWNFDTMRVGTTWSDVTPLVLPLSLDGPHDQAVCQGGSVNFSVTAVGTPPYSYTWRTNGVPISGATNSQFQLLSPGLAYALNSYDVIVHDSFGAVTSRVASLTVCTSPPVILSNPQDQLVLPSATDAVFSVVAAGQALTYQWRSNGVPVSGATNASYTINNPTAADPPVAYDVIVSNPCGTATSSPPASLLFPHVFYEAYDAGPGFFSGENLLFTNNSGLTLQAWSADSPGLPITGWSSAGAMQEQPLNDGSPRSIYSINVTPATSPAFYIFGSSLSAPYLPPVPVLTVTSDSRGFYALATTNMAVASNGALAAPGAAKLVGQTASGGLELSCAGLPGNTYLLQACSSLQPPLQWITVTTNVAGPDGLVRFSETNTSSAYHFFRMATP